MNAARFGPLQMGALMLAVFAVSVGYGVVLPLLPALVSRSLDSTELANASRHTGFLAGVYMLATFVFAPTWGRISDRRGRYPIILVALTGFAAAMSLLAPLVGNLPILYLERFLSGLFAAAVTPVALAAVADETPDGAVRARRLTMVSLSGVTGFLLGPLFGSVPSSFIAASPGGIGAQGLVAPMVFAALLALLAVGAVGIARSSMAVRVVDIHQPEGREHKPKILRSLYALSMLTSGAIGVFEVGISLRTTQRLGMSTEQLAAMFTECSLVMLVAQGIVFSPWIKPAHTRWLIAPAFGTLAIGLVFVSSVAGFTATLVGVGAVAASAGVISPVVTYWISMEAGSGQGRAMGTQTATSSLGQAAGSVLAGLLFNVTGLPDAPFVIIAILSLFAMWPAVYLAMRLRDATVYPPTAALSTVSERLRKPP